jgi:hypothetical protein
MSGVPCQVGFVRPAYPAESAMAGCFLRELHAGGEPEFGVDVGEMGLHGAR